MTERLCLSDFEIQLLVIERNVAQYRIEQIDEILNRVGAAKGYQDAKAEAPAAKLAAGVDLKEEAFTALKWHPQQSSQMGNFETAVPDDNDGFKFKAAYDALSKAGATIQKRFHGPGYVYGYWLFGPAKIYRQRLKEPAGR